MQIRVLAPDEKITEPGYIAECFSYNPEDGGFVWRERPRWHFATYKSFATWNAKFAGKSAMNSMDRGYRYSRVNRRKVYAHRAAWAISYGSFPPEIDHINGNPSDNRLSNLRSADRFTNNCNVRSARGSSSRYLGVYWSQKDQRWIASITKGGFKKVLGYFRAEIDAAKAYDAAAVAIHGAFANPNFQGSKP